MLLMIRYEWSLLANGHSAPEYGCMKLCLIDHMMLIGLARTVIVILPVGYRVCF